MASLIQWTWVWASSGSWWWTGKPGVLQSMGSQRVGHDWATELNWLITHMSLVSGFFFFNIKQINRWHLECYVMAACHMICCMFTDWGQDSWKMWGLPIFWDKEGLGNRVLMTLKVHWSALLASQAFVCFFTFFSYLDTPIKKHFFVFYGPLRRCPLTAPCQVSLSQRLNSYT